MVPPLTRNLGGKRQAQEYYIARVHPPSLRLSASPNEVLILSSVLLLLFLALFLSVSQK